MSEAAGLSNVASAIVGAMQKWERKPADFYPTPPDVTYSLFPHIEALLPKGSVVLEPACGDGAMAKALIQCGYSVRSYDLREDSGYGIGGTDFLSATFLDNFDAVITNPPFNVADKFIARALDTAPVVAMLLKSQYWHAAKRCDLFMRHRPKYVLPLTWRPSFLEKERGSSPLMDVMWVVWDQQCNGGTDYYPIRRITTPPLPDFDAIFS